MSAMPTSDTITLSQADYVRLLVHGTTAFELLRTALELELFERLEKTAIGLTVDEVATALDVQPQAARVLLLGLSSLGLVEVHEGRHVNTPMVRRKLLRDSHRFLGPLVDIQARVINPAMGDLADAVRENRNVGLRHFDSPGDTLYQRLTAYPELQQVFYANMGDASAKALEQLLGLYDFSGLRHVVDLGGGDGTNAIAIAQRYPDLRVTVFDQPTVTTLAAERVDDPDVASRVAFQPADLLTDPLPTDADAICYLHIFEIWSLERNTELLRRCWEALPEGGVCLVYSFVSRDDGTGPMSAGLVSPYFLTLASGEGMTYSARDMAQAVRDAGFRQVEEHRDLGFSHALVVGRK